jgi:hypothetical protein
MTWNRPVPLIGDHASAADSETVRVSVAGREGSVRRPNLVGALVGKTAALSNVLDRLITAGEL